MTENILNTFTQNDYEIIKREVVYQGNWRVARYYLRFRLYHGEWSQMVVRELMERTSAVGVLLYDPVRDQVVLIEQFRPGAMVNPQSPWLVEVVAGIIDEDEKLEAVATRESQEEAGCEVLDLYHICDTFVSPGGSNEQIALFCGRIDATNAGGVHGLDEENENIQSFVLSSDEAFIWLQEGRIKTAPAIITLQWLQLNKDWLRQLWQTK